jgi:hypothetical protein
MRCTLAVMLLVGTTASCGGRTQTGWSVGDGGRPAEASVPSCFGGQATSAFAGSYTGPWSGTWSCWGGVTLSGKIVLTLTATASGLSTNGSFESFTELPAIDGTVSGAVACSGTSAVMTGTLPRVTLTGSGVAYNLAGSLSATFVPSTRQLSSGTWTVNANDGSGCTGKGTWSATQ